MTLASDVPKAVGDGLTAYTGFWTSITPASIEAVRQVVAPDFRFRDPFNECTGYAGIEGVLKHMFRTTKEPRFELHYAQLVHSPRDAGSWRAALRWTFRFTPAKARRQWQIEGMSDLTFAPDGLCRAHIDHWDSGSQFYRRLPMLGLAIRGVERAMKV